MFQIKNISEVTEPLKEQILKGDVHTIDEMRAWLKPLGYSDTINIEPIIIMGLYHHRNLVGSRDAFMKGNCWISDKRVRT